MSSFKRRIQPIQGSPMRGTLPVAGSSSLLQLSTGVPSLDDLLGGGLPLGHVLLVLAPDSNSAWGELLSRYFIAQGLSSEQRVLVYSDQPSRLVSGCMWHPGTPHIQQTPLYSQPILDDDPTHDDAKVTIAWRYEHMKQFKTTVDDAESKNDGFCHPFDLATTVPLKVIQTAIDHGRLVYGEASSNGQRGSSYAEVLTRIRTIVEQKARVPLRICIDNLGSHRWGEATAADTLEFLIRLRSLVRNTEACVLIALTPHLSSPTYSDHWIPKLAHLSDACVTLQGITSDPVLGPTFPAYSGLLSIHATPSPHTFLDPSRRFSQLRGLNITTHTGETGGGENNLAFKCMRKRFVVETLHLDVEGGVGERRTTPSASTIANISSPQDNSASEAHRHLHPAPLAKVSIEAPLEPSRDMPSSMASEPPKKAKKKVAFRAHDSDLYDF